MSTATYGPDLTIPARFCGPASSGNGGYTSGSLAERVATDEHPVVEVTLRQPPPLEVGMKVQHLPVDDPTNVGGSAVTVLLMGGAKIAEARAVDTELVAVEAVSRADAAVASKSFAGLRGHPFPTCFTCGPERAEGDGLRIFPGRAGDGRVAAVWTPHESLAEISDVLPPDEGQQRVGLGTAWAALDCVGGWASDIDERPMVLGRMTAQVDALPVVGEPHVVVGRTLGAEGRKTFTASTVYDSDDRIVGRAQHVWIEIDVSSFT